VNAVTRLSFAPNLLSEARKVLRAANRRKFMMMDMTTMSTGMMLGMGVYHLIIVAFAVLGIAASIKYLRS
jgi:hypothetical protein